MLVLLSLIATVVFAYLILGFVPVSQNQAIIIERQGGYLKTLGAGWHWITPVLEKVAYKFDNRETLHDFEPTAVITADNATVRINAVTYFKITNFKDAAYKVQNFERAMEQLIITSLRNLIGELELDECLNGRNTINTKLQEILDEATAAWGLKVSRVELKEIKPLGDIADAMDKQMVAERTRRAQILEAEGSKRAAILQAEGAKESAVLRAEGEREVLRIKAQAEAEAAVIRAKAQADATLIAAKAQQESIKEVVAAFGNGGDEKFLQLRYLESLPEMAKGPSSTIFMPNGMNGLAGVAALAGEAFRAGQPRPSVATPTGRVVGQASSSAPQANA
ncbi:MAG: SPFH domain-containing protein [Candidatus Sericytochromatia bacterium]|nr:SPFH domain-containing protein [Candidatus Sericytochromatia bacterium]